MESAIGTLLNMRHNHNQGRFRISKDGMDAQPDLSGFLGLRSGKVLQGSCNEQQTRQLQREGLSK